MSTLSSSSSTLTPYTRSRTSLFLSYRDSAIRPSPASPYPLYEDEHEAVESKGLLSEMEEGRRGSVMSLAGASRGRATAALPPKWVDLADRVQEVLDRLKPKMAQLDKLHAKHLLPGFKDRSAEEREIDTLADSITSDFRSIQGLIRAIAELSRSLLRTPLPPRATAQEAESKRLDLIMAANVQTALATKVQELSAVFRRKQTGYLRQLKGNTDSRSATASPVPDSTANPLASLAADEAYSVQSLTQASSSVHLTQRENEITSIATSIIDLSDLFKDLSTLVIDQGTLLDRVDWNVEQMGGEIRGAVEELKEATRHQRRSGKCQLIFLLLLLIMGCIIIILYRPSHAFSSPPSLVLSPTPAGNGEPDSDRVRGKRRLGGRIGLAGAPATGQVGSKGSRTRRRARRDEG